MLRNALVAFAVLVAASCATAPQIYPAGAPCEARSFTVVDDFGGARRGSCEVLGRNHVRVSILPEDAGYINPSPWFSFKVIPKTQSKALITLHYVGGKHRYDPKTSIDGVNWTAIDERRVSVEGDGMLVDIEVPLTQSASWISAQELVTPDDYDTWYRNIVEGGQARLGVIGQSLEGRPIHLLDTGASTDDVLLLTGRQHPPEVSGAIAMFTFIDTLLADTELAIRFRERVRILAVPLMNPDGVLGGHWRHNLGSKDLNRDWGEWEQPETRAVSELLDRLDADGQRIRVFLDFHSTDRNVFYTQDDTVPTTPPEFFDAWFARAKPRIADYDFTNDAGPGKRSVVAKNYMYARYGIPAATYEVGDETDRDAARAAAVIFAEELMREMLETLAPASR